MPETPTDAALYDLVCPTLLSAKYLLERLQRRHEEGWGQAEEDIADDVATMIQHLATAATAVHAWAMSPLLTPRSPMHIYLAAQYRRRDELCTYKADLEALGHTVTSRWLLRTPAVADNGEDPLPHAASIRCAQEDMADVARAQVLIAFTEPPRSPASRGGRHAELGLALAWGKQVVIVGPRENVFCHLPEVRHYATWADCLKALEDAHA